MSTTYEVTVIPHVGTYWRLNGKIHRENGPAIQYPDGSKTWCQTGRVHREDGPAIERADGGKSWYLNDIKLTEAEFNAHMNPIKELTLAEIEKLLGYPVKVVK